MSKTYFTCHDVLPGGVSSGVRNTPLTNYVVFTEPRDTIVTPDKVLVSKLVVSSLPSQDHKYYNLEGYTL